MDTDILTSDVSADVLECLQASEGWLEMIACFFFLLLVFGICFVMCKVIYKLIMRFA